MVTLSLWHGDCLQLMRDISNASIDLIICDLPYGCLTGGAGKEKKKRQETGGVIAGCAWDIPIDLEAFWKEVRRIRRSDHTPTIHFCTTKFGFDLYASNPKEFRYDLVWDKQRGVSFLSANKMPMRSHEMIYVFIKAGAFYNRVDISGNFKGWGKKAGSSETITAYSSRMPNGWVNNGNDGSTRCVLSVISHPAGSKKGGHPTEKSTELYKWLIERYCPVGGTVFDPTFGSGNSVFTAFEMGRSAIGIEKDDKFFQKASERQAAL
jgi:site-specific DNA-methyltransferase (adenine-specific)